MNLAKIATALVLIALSATLILKNKHSAKDANTFVVGTAAGYAPFVSINPNGDYEGFDIDVATAVAHQLNKKLVIKDLGSMAPLFTALEQGSIDAIIWGMSITQERLNNVAMVNYHGDTTQNYALLFWDAAPAHITTLADMSNKTICVEPTSVQEKLLDKYPAVHKLPTEKIDDALLNIQYGKADAALVEPAIAQKFQRVYPNIKVLNIPLDPEDRVHGLGIVVQKNNTTLINDIERAVAQLKETGAIKQFAQRWDIPA